MRLLSLNFLFLALTLPFAATDPAPAPVSPAIVRVPWSGAPKKLDPSVKLAGPEFELLTIQGAIGPITWDATTPDSFALPVKIVELKPKDGIIGLRIGSTTPDRYDAPDTPTVAVFAINTGRATIAAWGVKDGKPVKLATFAVEANLAPQPPPGPGPKPPDPAPVPVTSFRVILISETANNLTPAQRAVLDGVTVENFLNATCTGGKAGWRRRDKDQAGDADPTMAAMWNATKPKITTVPCVAVGVNDKVDIIPLEATPEAMVAVLKKYAEGK